VNVVWLLGCAALGVAIGIVFFGGLWLTVGRLATAGRPALLALSSLIARLFIAALGFGLALRAGWPGLLAALAGFIAVRTVAVARFGPTGSWRPQGEKVRDAADAR